MPEARQSGRSAGHEVLGPDRKVLRRLADSLSDGVAVCREGRIVWANRRLAALAGRPREALRGERVQDLLAADAERPDGDDEVETRLARADGGACAVRAVRIPGPDVEATWIFRDCARSGELEEEVGSLGRALHAANRELETLRERVRRQRADLDEVLNVVSHELRTPVTVVTGYARLLLSDKVGTLNADQRGFVEESLKSCRRMNAFIANLLETSRHAADDGPLQVREASLAPTLESVAASLEPLLDEHGFAVRLDLHPDTPLARFDPLRIERVVCNLIENAVKYAGPGGTLTVATRPRRVEGALHVEVSVADEGPGVPEADRERIFERYVRVGDRSEAGSLGLGLAICRRSVETHGGVIRVTDADGGGARFCFTLPAAPAAGENGVVGAADAAGPDEDPA